MGVDEVGKRHGRPRRAALSTSPCSAEHGNDGGQLLGGAELDHGGAVAMVVQEARGTRGEEEGLTARRKKGPRQVRSAGEGRIDDGGVAVAGDGDEDERRLRCFLGSSGGRQSKESTPAELTDRVSEREAAGGRDNDGGRRRLCLGRGSGGEKAEREREENGEAGVAVGEGGGLEASGGGDLIISATGTASWSGGDARARTLGRLNRGRGTGPGKGRWAGLL